MLLLEKGLKNISDSKVGFLKTAGMAKPVTWRIGEVLLNWTTA